MSFPTIALISDFGNKDGFSGVVKGVIYSMVQNADNLTCQQPSPPIIDISHEIPPQNIWDGAWVLNNTYQDFPEFSIFICIVDPKIGESRRKQLLLYWPERKQYFIGPDNGLLTPIILAAGDNLKAYEIENQEFLRSCNNRGRSYFNGRDVYAAVGAHLANALIKFMPKEFLQKVGPAIETTGLTLLDWKKPIKDDHYIEGQIYYCDHFGNLITNIPNEWLGKHEEVEIQLLNSKWPALHIATCVPTEGKDKVYLVPTSAGTLELTQFKQNAKEQLGSDVGETITLHIK